MLKVNGLVKTFKKAKRPAVDNISFVVEEGDVFGIIGKNGAGKSTTIKCITGIIPYERGTITVNSHDMLKKPNLAKSQMGYVPDNHMLYEDLTGREYINFMADVYGVSEKDRISRINKYAKSLNIEDSLDLQINGYSHGMHQKICIIGALIHEPKLWILDEPFLGLDPQSRQVVKQCIKDFSCNKKHMVIFTSHDLETVVEMCNKILVLENGKIKAQFRVNRQKNVLMKKLSEIME